MHHDDRAIPGALDVNLGDVGVRLDRPLKRPAAYFWGVQSTLPDVR